mgnify:CR=1 FL=1|jgi:hypothetical protein
MALPVSRLVRVLINLAPIAAARRSFGVLMVAGDSNVINGLERFRTYDTIEGVAADFGVNAPEYKAAQAYFGQTPKPRTIMIGRWIRSASAAENIGGILSASQQTISNWTAISNGGFVIVIDGVTKNLTALDFTGVTNLNGVATVINSSLTGATIAWNGKQFVVTSNSTGDGNQAVGTITLTGNPSYGARATNTIELTGQPDPGDTVTIQGTEITFVSGTPGANEVEIGALVADTANNLLAFLQASSDANIALMTYSKIGEEITATARVYGTAGNAYTLAKSGLNITIGGGTFSGGVAPDTLTINGTAFTFVSALTTGNQILVGPTAEATAANIKSVLSASVISGVAEATYSVAANIVTVTYKTAGTAGNSFTLAETSSAITISGGTLSGGAVASSVGYATAGSGTDISSMLGLVSGSSLALVPGYDAETPVQCAAVLADKSNAWYGLMFQASVQPSNDQSLAVSDFIEALDVKRIYGVTITDTSVLSSLVSNDLASLQKAAGYLRSFCQYSENAYAIASLFGRAFSVNFNAENSTITLMYKQEPSIVPASLSTTEANVLKDKRCNVFVEYDNDTAIIQYGVMSGPAYIDEIHGLDWLQNAIQTECYNLLYTSPTKIPQTDAGSNQLVNVINGVLGQAVLNGLIAPGIWNSPVEFGQLKTGQYLKTGFYVYVLPMALQSQSDREQRVCPPIQIAIKLAGAIQELDIVIDVNR